jgi:hypothetical protein
MLDFYKIAKLKGKHIYTTIYIKNTIISLNTKFIALAVATLF